MGHARHGAQRGAVFMVQFTKETKPETPKMAKLMADSESGSPDSYLSLLVTIRLSRLVSEVFESVTERRTDRQCGPLL